MSYRSDVAIKARKEASRMILDALKEIDCAPMEIIQDKEAGEDILLWKWASWNSYYDDVRTVEAVLSELDKIDTSDPANEEYGYKFLRLGEVEEGDVEERTNCGEIELTYHTWFDLPEDEDMDSLEDLEKEGRLAGFLFCHGGQDFSLADLDLPEKVKKQIYRLLLPYMNNGWSVRNVWDMRISEIFEGEQDS